MDQDVTSATTDRARMDTIAACPVCGNTTFEPVALLRDNRIGTFKQRFSVARCTECGLFGLQRPPTAVELMAAYEEEYLAGSAPGATSPVPSHAPNSTLKTAVMDRVRHAWHLVDGNATIDRVPARGRVLDVGVSYGYSVAYLRRQGCDVLGIEPSPDAVAFCQAQGLPVMQGTLETVDLPPESFDTVILSQVLEHLLEPEVSLRIVFRILRPGGRLCVLTPNAAGLLRRVFDEEWAHWHVPFHVYLYDPAQLRQLLEKSGFRAIRLSTLTPAFWANMSVQMCRHRSQTTDWTISKDIHDWQPHPAVRLAIAPVLRTVDLLRQGDCLRGIAVKP